MTFSHANGGIKIVTVCFFNWGEYVSEQSSRSMLKIFKLIAFCNLKSLSMPQMVGGLPSAPTEQIKKTSKAGTYDNSATTICIPS